MLESWFGPDQIVTRFIAAFVIVFILIALIAWIARRFTGSRLHAGGTRGRQPRLAVIDAASLDGRRRLVLIRRDNVEHLIMIGGPTDVVVEQNIIRAVPVNPPRDAPPMRGQALDSPMVDTMTHSGAPPIAQQQRTFAAGEAPALRSGVGADITSREPQMRGGGDPRRGGAEEDWAAESPDNNPRNRGPEPAPRVARQAEPPLRLGKDEQVVMRPSGGDTPARAQPPAPRDAPDAAGGAANPDKDLADMAHRLETALRRPGGEQPPRPRPPAPRGPADTQGTRPPAPYRPGENPPRGGNDARPPQAPPKNGTDQGRSVLDSLEEEMASLLGKPGGKER